jgi:hypothetical protein
MRYITELNVFVKNALLTNEEIANEPDSQKDVPVPSGTG